ncbi:MAG: hypothetical protein KAR83_00935, partial [Thermodesulfovibrionales bacterium]|nr:hypothetical protein [Thermodesulfovibrionales bacterium]
MSMRRGSHSRAAIFAGFIILFTALSFHPAFAPGAHAAAVPMKNYCVVPPYVKTDIEPNILLIMDNSHVNASYAYGDEEDYSAANTYAGNSVKTNDDRYEGPFDPDILYTYDGSNKFNPDNGTTMDPDCNPPVNSECGKPGAFDGNMLSWAVTSRYDLIMTVMLGGAGTPSATSNDIKPINDTYLDALGVEQTEWPFKKYVYWGDSDGNGTTDTFYRCDIKMSPGAASGNLVIEDSAWVPCGLLLDPPVGPAAVYSYATVASAVNITPQAPGPVMYAGPLAPMADGDILTKEEREKMVRQMRAFIDSMLGLIGPDEAWAGGPIKIDLPNKTTEVKPYTEDVVAGVWWEFLLSATAGNPPCIDNNTAQGWYCWGQPNPADSDFSTIFNTTTQQWYVAGTPDMVDIGTTYDFSILAADGSTNDRAYFEITIVNTLTPPDPGSQSFTPWVCAGDYVVNCDTDKFTDIKQGLMQDYWTRARFGVETFQRVDGPKIDICVESRDSDTMDSNVGNAVKNSNPLPNVTDIGYLVDALHEGILGFMGENSGSACDPFEGEEKECRNNFILMLTSAEGADLSSGSDRVFSPLPSPDCVGAESDLAKNACYGYNTDLRSASVGAAPIINGVQKVSTYIVDAMSTNPANSEILQEAARFGGGNYYGVENPRSLREELKQAFEDIIKRAASGTAASVLASGEGSGANLIQAIYYPRRKFLDSAAGAYDEITWIGRLTNFWYYV